MPEWTTLYSTNQNINDFITVEVGSKKIEATIDKLYVEYISKEKGYKIVGYKNGVEIPVLDYGLIASEILYCNDFFEPGKKHYLIKLKNDLSVPHYFAYGYDPVLNKAKRLCKEFEGSFYQFDFGKKRWYPNPELCCIMIGEDMYFDVLSEEKAQSLIKTGSIGWLK